MLFKCRTPALSPDTQDMQNTLRLLDVSEFRLFELAYQEWFGRAASESELERAFVPYLFFGELPCWVRHYNRSIRSLAQEGGVIDHPLELPSCELDGESGSIMLSVTPSLLMMCLLSMLVIVL